jgi:hypothetical protein
MVVALRSRLLEAELSTIQRRRSSQLVPVPTTRAARVLCEADW